MTPDAVIVDTDAGPDDLVALAFLLAHPNVSVEAITTVGGVTPAILGARSVLSLLALAGEKAVPVYVGANAPIAFPDAWTTRATQLANGLLPATTKSPQERNAATFLRQRLQAEKPLAHVLALGPLTNIAQVIASNAEVRLVVMGGAYGGSGNVSDHPGAEWNFYADSDAANQVMQNALNAQLVPLDAAASLPLIRSMESMLAATNTPLALFAAEVLRRTTHMASAFDLAAAAVLTSPHLFTWRCHGVSVHNGIAQEANGPPVTVAYQADNSIFRKTVYDAFRPGAQPRA